MPADPAQAQPEPNKHVEVQKSCDDICRAAMAEPDQRKQLAMLLGWIVEMGNAKKLDIVPPLDKMLGIKTDG